MRAGERRAWRDVARAADKVANSDDYAKEFIAKIELRAAWAKLYGIPNTSGLPRSGAT